MWDVYPCHGDSLISMMTAARRTWAVPIFAMLWESSSESPSAMAWAALWSARLIHFLARNK
jgi:hypothetical protein